MSSLHGRNVAVIGAEGFIGRHVVAALMKAGAQIRAVDLQRPATVAGGRIEWWVGDISDSALISAVVSGCDTVIFLATRSLPATANSNMAAEIRSHVEGSVAVAEIALAQGVERFLFASSGGTVYGGLHLDPIGEDFPKSPRNAYGVSKLSIEHYLRLLRQLRGLKSLSLRISNPYGELQRSRGMQGFIAAAMEQVFSNRPLPIWGDGAAIRDFVYVGDVASAFVKGCNYNGEASEMNIGSGRGWKLLEVARAVEKAAKMPLQLEFQPARSIDVAANVLDITRAGRELGWHPETELEDGLARTAEWWRQSRLL